MDGRGDQCGGGQPDQREAAAVEECLELIDPQNADRQRAQSGQSDGVQREVSGRSARAAGLPDEGEGCAKQQAAGPRIRAVVEPGGIRIGLIQCRHRRDRRRGAREGCQGGQTRPTGRHQQGEQERPEQVELLFHGQRPQVSQQRRPPDGFEIRLVAEDLVPVVHIHGAAECVAAKAGSLIGQEHDDEPGHGQQDREQRRQQTPRAPQPECLEVDAALQ